jgi:hypothetical protein
MCDHLGVLLVALCNALQLPLRLRAGLPCCRFRCMRIRNRALQSGEPAIQQTTIHARYLSVDSQAKHSGLRLNELRKSVSHLQRQRGMLAVEAVG